MTHQSDHVHAHWIATSPARPTVTDRIIRRSAPCRLCGAPVEVRVTITHDGERIVRDEHGRALLMSYCLGRCSVPASGVDTLDRW